MSEHQPQQPGVPPFQPAQPGYPQPYQPYPLQPVVAAKSPGLALVASFFFPGLGSLINGNVGIGILIFFLYCVSWLLVFAVIGFVLVPVVWAWGMYDGYHGAKQWNTRHGIVS